jgi:hypothetical protein
VNVYISGRKRVARNTIFRKAPPSVISGYGKRSINLNAKYGIDIQIVRPEMTKFKIFKEEIFILWELHSKMLVGDKNLL